MRDDREEVTISDEGITVRKSLNAEQFQTLAVVFDLLSERDEAVRIQLIDQMPSAVDMDDVGFHPEYGGEHWTSEDARVVFERTFEPGEEYTTIYGVRDVDLDDVDLLGEPEIEIIDEPTVDVDDVVPPERSQVVRDLITGEADAEALVGQASGEPARAEEPEPVAATADVGGHSSDEPDSYQTEASGAGSGEVEAESTSSDRDAPAPAQGGVARVLAKELRDGRVSEPDRGLLVEALAGGPGSLDARIEHLQARVSDLDAYTNALEGFLDDHGPAQELLDDIDDRMDDLDRSMADLHGEVDQVDGRADHVADRVSEVEATTSDIEEAVTGLRDDVADLRGDIGTIRDDLDQVDELGRQLDGVERDLDGLRDDFDRMRADLDEMASFRDRLSTVFGSTEAGGEALEETEE